MTSQVRGVGAPAAGAPRFGRRTLLTGAAALGVGASLGLAGCGGSRQAQPMQFWQFYAPQETGEPQQVAQSAWFTQVMDGWNARNERQVVPLFVPDYVNPMNPRIATAFAGDVGPDVFLISPGEFLRYYNGGVLTDLRPFMTQEAIDDFYPDALGTRIVDGGIFALPMEVEPLSMYYDIAAFEEAGLSEGDLPTTWDGLLDIAERLTTPLRSGLVLETAPGYYQNFTFYPWIWQGGGEVVDPRTQQAAFASEPVIAAMQLYADSIVRGVSPRTLPASGEIVNGFKQGLAAMWQRGPWSIEEFNQQSPGYPYGNFPLPTPPGGQSTTCAGGWAWVVNNRGRDPEAAARFVVEAVGSTSLECVTRLADWSGRAKSNLPARRSVFEAMQALPSASDPNRIAVAALRDSARGEPRYPPVLYKAMSNAIQAVQLAGGSPQQQADTAQSAIEGFLLTYEGGTLV